jgi:hypothetical protein
MTSREIEDVLARLAEMRQRGIWPNVMACCSHFPGELLEPR